MSEFVSLFQNFLYVLSATVLAITAYSAYDRYMDRQEKKEILKNIADTHQIAVQSILGMHSISKSSEPIEKTEKKESQPNGTK